MLRAGWGPRSSGNAGVCADWGVGVEELGPFLSSCPAHPLMLLQGAQPGSAIQWLSRSSWHYLLSVISQINLHKHRRLLWMEPETGVTSGCPGGEPVSGIWNALYHWGFWCWQESNRRGYCLPVLPHPPPIQPPSPSPSSDWEMPRIGQPWPLPW